MASFSGALVKIYQGDGATPTEGFDEVIGGRNVTWDFAPGTFDGTTADDVDANGKAWSNMSVTRLNFTCSIDGIVKDKTAFAALMAAAIAGTKGNWRLDIGDFRRIQGPMIITSWSGGGNFDEDATYQLTLSGGGILTSSDPAA